MPFFTNADVDAFELSQTNTAQVYNTENYTLNFSREYSTGNLSNASIDNKLAHLIAFDFDLYSTEQSTLDEFIQNSKNGLIKMNDKIYQFFTHVVNDDILFVLYGNDRVIYSCVTDSFLYQNQPAVKVILDDANINQIADLFWTHPHDDHSDGLIEIVKTFKPKRVFLPTELQSLPENTAKISRDVLDKLNSYRGYDKRYKTYQPKVQGIGANSLIKDETIKVGTMLIPFSICAISPSLGKIRKKAINQDYNALNDYSIAVSILVGDFSLLLTGDIQDQMLQYLSDELVKEVPIPNILKIPHHGSKYSLGITSLFEEEPSFDIAITTAKSSSELPKQEALDHYRTYSKHLYKVNSGAPDLAIWGVEVDILHATITQIVNNNYVAV